LAATVAAIVWIALRVVAADCANLKKLSRA